MTTTRGRPPRLPRAAQPLARPLWLRTQSRLRDRHGFDLNAPDLVERTAALLAMSPGDAERRLLHAAALSTRGEDERAEAEVRAALETDPALARAHTTLATLLVRRGAHEEGLGHARRAAELASSDPTVQYNLGLAEHVNGHRREASAAFGAAARLLEQEGALPPRRRWWPRRSGA